MHAYLVTGGNPEERTEWAENFFKTQGILETTRIDHPLSEGRLSQKNHLIKTVRGLIHTLLFSPADPKRGRGVLMEDAHLLTTEAANAFLKTLEEPLGNTTLILTAPNREAVLPTIASRALHIDLGTTQFKINDEEKEQATTTFTKLIKAGVGERLEFVEKLNKRDEALKFCITQIFAVREALRNKITGKAGIPLGGGAKLETGNSLSTTQLTALVTHLEQTRQDLEANVNVKLSLTELLLHYQ